MNPTLKKVLLCVSALAIGGLFAGAAVASAYSDDESSQVDVAVKKGGKKKGKGKKKGPPPGVPPSDPPPDVPPGTPPVNPPIPDVPGQ